MYDDIDDNLHPDEDYSYTWPVGNEEVVVQWELMAEHGIITHETAARLSAADAEYVKAVLARRRPSRMSEVNRLKFMRTLSLWGRTEADLAPATPRPERVSLKTQRVVFRHCARVERHRRRLLDC